MGKKTNIIYYSNSPFVYNINFVHKGYRAISPMRVYNNSDKARSR